MPTHRASRSPARRRATGDATPESMTAQRVAAAIRGGRGVSDGAFDQLLPPELRNVSSDYWTPLPVIRRVAAWLRAERVGTLVDIGSGPGKFCVAVALLAPCRVVGLEHRQTLVAAAERMARLFELEDRVTFVTGAFGEAPTPAGDAYYLFNPFGEYAFSALREADDGVTYSEQTYTRDVDAMVRFLARARPGTVVITYNGFGADLPASYEQTRVDLGFRGALRLWKKRRPRELARTSFRVFLPEIEPPDTGR